MAKKIRTPKKLRQDLKAANGRILLLAQTLKLNESQKHWGLGALCTATAQHLIKTLDDNSIPEDYRVAVIGRFKAGKSSFVNELLEQKLASEDTNPETAAITSFKNGPVVKATIRFVESEVWRPLVLAHDKDSNDPEAHRVKKWRKFSEVDEDKDDTAKFDLAEVERTHVKPGGHEIVILRPTGATAEQERKNGVKFRKDIKQYTSGARPYHCLVEAIEIETPSNLLEEGVTLIDTPGLDDTERFRVQLTENAVEDVDCVLFLTKSGASYGQSEKEFLLSLLRKGTVKQLLFVVTQVDQTYEQYIRQAEDNDEDPEPISNRIGTEERRLRNELVQTLAELAENEDSVSASKYNAQLENVEIVFTSALNHRDWLKSKTVSYPILKNDPGGMKAAKTKLYSVLSTESRLANAVTNTRTEAAAAIEAMLASINQRKKTMKQLRNKEEAERKLSTFREQFGIACRNFEKLILEDQSTLLTNLTSRSELQLMSTENVVLIAKEVLADYENVDSSKHWKTRRHQNWGFMNQVQKRIANRIFPKVNQELSKMEEQFSRYVARFNRHLLSLSQDGEKLCSKIGVSEDFALDVTGDLELFLENALNETQRTIEGEEARITSVLDDFVDEEVSARLSSAREKVADVWGRGTTNTQTSQVRDFYQEVKTILGQAIKAHVVQRYFEFAEHLKRTSEALPKEAISEINSQLDKASEDIRVAAEASLKNDQDAFFEEVERISSFTTAEIEEIVKLIDNSNLSSVETSAIDGNPPKADDDLVPTNQIDDAKLKTDDILIRELAVNLLDRIMLENGHKKQSFEKIFSAKWVKDASIAWIIDPYLEKPHQKRNLKEVLSAILKNTALKTAHVITTSSAGITKDQYNAQFQKLEQELFQEKGLSLKLDLQEDIHDRFLILDNGNVWKLGRGLDIFKTATGLQISNPELRQVRRSEIDLFGP